MTAFVPGLDLSRHFYHELVWPILDADFSGLLYSAVLLGHGSEVLGFDDEMSTDHDWRPRVLLFLGEEDQARLGEDVGDALRRELPLSFRGRPVDDETVRAFARIRAKCRAEGHPLHQKEHIGDLWIAATAIR